MRIVRAGLLVVLLAALVWPVQSAPLCPDAAPPTSCCCPPGADGCGPQGCCCVRDGAPAEPNSPGPSTVVVAGSHDPAPRPAPIAPALEVPSLGAQAFATSSREAVEAAPSLLLVLCTFRC